MEPRDVALRAGVQAKYARVAERPDGHFPYPVGRAGALAQGYDPEWLVDVPEEVVSRFVGVGNPFRVRRPAPGERVLDVGCGCGLDVFVAARMVGRGGHAAGIDLTPAMVDVASRAAERWPLANASFHEGSAESLPFGDGSFDVVTSNGALNLVPDKDAAFREIRRVLREGGTFAAADLLVVDTLPADVLTDMDAWST